VGEDRRRVEAEIRSSTTGARAPTSHCARRDRHDSSTGSGGKIPVSCSRADGPVGLTGSGEASLKSEQPDVVQHGGVPSRRSAFSICFHLPQTDERRLPVGSRRSCTNGACAPVSRIWSARLRPARPEAGRSSSIWNGRRRPFRAAYLHRVLRRDQIPAAWTFGGPPSRLGPGQSLDLGRTVRLGLAPRGVCLAAPVTGNAGALLPHPFTPYRADRGPARRDCSLLHVPSAPPPSKGA